MHYVSNNTSRKHLESTTSTMNRVLVYFVKQCNVDELLKENRQSYIFLNNKFLKHIQKVKCEK